MGVGAQLVKRKQTCDNQHHSLGKGDAHGCDGSAGRQVEHCVGNFEDAEGLPHEQRSACGCS